MNPDLRGPLRVCSFAESDRLIADEQMLDGYVCNGEFGIDNLLETINKLKADHPGTHLLASLDDFQASYTSDHAFEKHKLGNNEGHDLSHLPRTCFDEDGEYLGEMNTPEEFSLVIDNFRKQVAEITFADICTKVRALTSQMDETAYWKDCERMSEMLDGEARILVTPFQHAHETLIAFPNGYFQGDFTPFENFELARHMEERIGLKLFGVGSAYLAFTPSRPLSKEDVDTLLYLFRKMGDARFDDHMTEWLNKHRYVLIPYSEGLI